MLASQFIERLSLLISLHGDRIIVNEEDETVDVEFNDDSIEPVFVIV